MTARALAVLACLGALVAGSAPSYAAPPPPVPEVRVLPTTGLSGGDTVRVRASGLPPSTEVLLVQCDGFGDRDSSCPAATPALTSARGTLRTRLTLADPVFRRGDVGRDRPVYCRADQCRIGVVLRDGSGLEELLAQTDPLTFRGSAATVAVRPATDLPASRWVVVSGTARGAAGRSLAIAEQVCFDLVQEVGCYARAAEARTRVRPDGTFRLAYRVTRHLADGDTAVDCAATEEILGYCVVTATVLDRAGRPDDSFGLAAYGEPSAGLAFTGAG